jgi:hypothetical protein
MLKDIKATEAVMKDVGPWTTAGTDIDEALESLPEAIRIARTSTVRPAQLVYLTNAYEALMTAALRFTAIGNSPAPTKYARTEPGQPNPVDTKLAEWKKQYRIQRPAFEKIRNTVDPDGQVVARTSIVPAEPWNVRIDPSR